MENIESNFVTKGTNPFLTVLFFGTIVAVLVTSGSYFSKQRSDAREMEDRLAAPIAAMGALSR